MSDLPFTCGCGIVHDAASWSILHIIGHTCFPSDTLGPEQHLEMRNCPCGSTKAVEVASGHDGCTVHQKETEHV